MTPGGIMSLPQWPTPPADVAAATREIKAAMRERIGDVKALFADIEAFITAEVEDIEATKARGESVWPIIDYADIEAGTVTPETLAYIKRRGCAVIRGQFPEQTAREWDASLIDYVDSNNFMEAYKGPADNFFGTLDASRPEIYPIYWSPAQMEARQDKRMATVQSFLNSQWKHESEGRVWFDPNQDSMYPDRIRRRPPGTTSKGLGSHTDSGALERWFTGAYQLVNRHLLNGDFASYDPWDAAYRTEVDEYDTSTMCSVFRSFQGWVALSEMKHDQGVLHTVPIPAAMAYLLIRPLLEDVPEDSLCDTAYGFCLPINDQWHPLLMRANTGIPDVRPGDTVWWHCDMIHSVAPVENQEGWGNVMYIPAAPMCEKNMKYARDVAERFLRGESPSDFPKEDYEVSWAGRFDRSQLNEIGERGLGLGV
ncbi:DUF1479 domain-containing protein [Micrococcales bacterium 31B]|nr:DUF1479 domain-containing protein [Micrococcales bacterium 31B]